MSELTMIRTDCESEFDRVYRDAQFFATLYEQNREMENFVNESLIKASGNKRAINEMYIINEAAAGDKIKAFFEKIKNFFKKIFDKLGASMNALFGEQKKYIEKYQYIITKCKYQAGDVNDVYDHFKGLSRILDVVDNAESAILSTNIDKYCKASDKGGVNDPSKFIDTSIFASADNINNFELDKLPVVKPEEQRAKAFEDFTKAGYWANIQDGFTKETDANGNVDINESFRAYFNGSKDTVSWSVDEIENNMQSIINTVYAGQSYLNKLERIVTTVQKKMDEISKSMDDYYKAQKDKILTATKNTNNTSDDKNNEALNQAKQDAKNVEDAAEQGNKNAKKIETDSKNTEPKNTNDQRDVDNYEPAVEESTKYRLGRNGRIFSEANLVNNSSNNSDQPKGAPVAGGGVPQVNAASKANENISKQTVNKQQAQDVKVSGVTDGNKDTTSKKAEEMLNKDINNRQAEVNADIMISTSIANNLFNAFKLTNKDFFSILQFHVQWYLSNPGAEKQSENILSRTHSLDMNATTTPVSKGNTNNATPAKTQPDATNTYKEKNKQ